LVWIPKYRKKILYGNLRKYLGDILRELALQKESKIMEGHLVGDHVHILISIPPKYAVSQVVGYIKGKAQSILRGHMLVGNKTSPATFSGPEVTMYQLRVVTKKQFVGTYRSRKN